MRRGGSWGQRALRGLFGAALGLGTGALFFVGCTLDRGGTQQQTCTVASECVVSDARCQEAVCEAGICGAIDRPDGPLTEQTVDDCAVASCSGGVALLLPDDTDRPTDHDCASYICDGPTVVASYAAENTACAIGGEVGLCDGKGECQIVCEQDDDCPYDLITKPCKIPYCDTVAGLCAFDPGPDGPSPNEDPDDCVLAICEGGVEKTVAATLGQSCIDPNDPSAIKCNGQGSCVACVDPVADCDAPGLCYGWQCGGGECVPSNFPPGTPVDGHGANDCKKRECDGNGLPIVVADPSDPPLDDGNQCTDEACLGVDPHHPPKGTTAACNLMPGSGFCNGAGACVQCNTPNQCQNQGTSCQNATCTSNVCGLETVASGTPCPTGFCSGTTCVQCTIDAHCTTAPNTKCDGAVGVCKRPLGASCTMASQCFGGHCVDGVCCENACSGKCVFCNNSGSCTPHPSGTDPQNECSSSADAGPDCNAGACACGYDPTPPGGACPAACTGGCSAGVCTIDCSAGSSCMGTVSCPAGWNCQVNCGGNGACAGATINCPSQYACNVSCSANNACQNAALNCGSNTPGTCALSCGGNASICSGMTMTCGLDQCTASCGGGAKAGFTFNAGNACATSNNCSP